MKYMHFRASCAWAALAALLEHCGIDTEDELLARRARLPLLYAWEDGSYRSGPMLQGARWMDLCLRPMGLRLAEAEIPNEQLGAVLRTGGPAMLGIATPYGRHAVVYERYDGAYCFLNPTFPGSSEPESLRLSEQELRKAAGGTVMVGSLKCADVLYPDYVPLLHRSAQTLRENVGKITAFLFTAHTLGEYHAALDPLFRALLLDGVTMQELAGEDALAAQLRARQEELMRFFRCGCTGLLADTLNLEALLRAAESWASRMEAEA